MIKRCAVAVMTAAVMVLPLVAATQDKPVQDKPKETTVIIKDDTTPKVKKGVRLLTDTEITTAVKTKFMKDKVARGTDIDVSTKDGVVTLKGAVPTDADKERIGRIAERTKGVKKVVNDLTVAPATPR